MTAIKVPDIGDYNDVPIIEILVSVGDIVEVEQSLLTLESDKATMEVPSPMAGIITSISVKLGDKVSQDSVIMEVDNLSSSKIAPSQTSHPNSQANSSADAGEFDCDLLVLGAGPGGYTAAFRAADLGLKVILVEKHNALGGVCLNVGCIPSKSLLHVVSVINETRDISEQGVKFLPPKIDINKIRKWKDSVVSKLTTGLSGLAKKRKIRVIKGEAKFISPNQISINEPDKESKISFKYAIIASGSSSIKIPNFPDDPRIFSSTGALSLSSIPNSLLVIGAGIIGFEMATVYATLGSKVTIVELLPEIMSGTDRDLVKPMQKRLLSAKENKIEIKTSVKVSDIKADKKGLHVSFTPATGDEKIPEQTFDKVLLSVGRRPNSKNIGIESLGVEVDERGFIVVNNQMRTNVKNIFAVGDVVGNPMLAHKASHQGKTAAEVISGIKSYFEPMCIPSVAYTDPEIAWVGLTETQAKAQGINYDKGIFPWMASGRALSMAREEGMTKIIFDKTTFQVLGGGIVGKNAGELIGELCLAVEMGVDLSDQALTIHPHPTLSETVGFAAEVGEGTVTDIYMPKRR